MKCQHYITNYSSYKIISCCAPVYFIGNSEDLQLQHTHIGNIEDDILRIAQGKQKIIKTLIKRDSMLLIVGNAVTNFNMIAHTILQLQRAVV